MECRKREKKVTKGMEREKCKKKGMERKREM